MRKLGTIGALVMAAAIFFTSCEKIETSELTLDLTQTATVKVLLYADLNLTTLGEEVVPNGTNVIVSIPNSSFNSTASGLWTTNAVVANGTIEVEVPVTNNGVTVTFTPAEFTYNQVQNHASNVATVQKLFKATSSYSLGSVKPGEVRTYEIVYNTIQNFESYNEFVTIKFKGWAQLNQFTGTWIEVPAGTTVTLFNSGWKTTATIGTAGAFSASVPKSISFNMEFFRSAVVDGGGNTKNYRFYENSLSYSTETPTTYDIYFNGQLWE